VPPMLKPSEAASANDIHKSSELLKIAAPSCGMKGRLVASLGNAILLNGVVQCANREIGVPGGLMIFMILVFVALVPIGPIRAILIAVPGMVVAMIFIGDAHATGTTRTCNGNQETCG